MGRFQTLFRIWRSPVFVTVFVTILLASAMLQFNLQPVKAQTITNVDVSPRITLGREAFTATVHGTYQASDGLDLTVVIVNIDGESVGGPSHYRVEREDPSAVQGEWQLSLVVNPPTSREELGHGLEEDPENPRLYRRSLWACVQETGERFGFYSMISDLTLLYVDIVDASWAPLEGEPVNPGDEVRVHLKYEVCPRIDPRHPQMLIPCYVNIWVGSGSTIPAPLDPVEWFSLGPANHPFQWEHRRGAVYRPISAEVDILMRIPDRGRDYDLDLTVGVYVQEENVEGCQDGQDQESFTIPVVHREDNDAWIDSVSADPAEADPGQIITVNVAGGYTVMEEGGIPLIVTLRVEDGYEYPHVLGAYVQGSGTFSEEFQVQAPPQEGEMHLTALVWREYTLYVFDQENVSVPVRAGAEHYCRITEVRSPQQVTPGQDFTVDVGVEWNLPQAPSLRVEMFSLSGIAQPVADAYALAEQHVGGTFLTCNIDGSRIPQRSSLPGDGHWTLRVDLIYGTGDILDSGDSRTFDVVVVGNEEGISGGASDWSIRDVSASPVNPFLGTGVTFVARIEVATDNPFPQRVGVSYSLDGSEQLRDSVTLENGMTFLAVSSPPWMPTLGQHTVRWEVDPDHEYDDPSRDNNVRELRFTVTESPRLPEGYPTEEQPTGEEFDYYVTAVPTDQTIRSPVTYTVTVNIVSGAPEPVQLELIGAPVGVSYYFDPPSGTPRYTSTLTVTAATDLPVGAYPMTIKASGGGKERYKPITLIVEEGPDYALSINPNSTRAKPGESVEFTVSVESETGYSQLVNLMASRVPNGVTWRMEPRASTPPFQSTLILELGRDVKPGAHTIVVLGSGADGERAAVTLWVEGELPRAGVDATIDYLAAAFLAIIFAAIFGGGFLAFRRVRRGRAKAFCVECGTRLAPGVEFCPQCGTKRPKLEKAG
jgi:hypothetical protein